MINFKNTYDKLPADFYQKVNPSVAITPELIVFNHTLAQQLGIDSSAINDSELAAIFSGKIIPSGASIIAMTYAGHQFGHFVPRLGDGRALLLGEIFSPIEQKNYDLHFKGSGPTPYSRRGDGKAALGPMLREYLMSEAIFHLGIPTTRSLSVVTTGDQVYREEVYPGAILTRVGLSHIRVGTFQYFAARNETHHLKTLLRYSLERLYPEILTQTKNEEEQALLFWKAVAENQLALIAKWMGIGFIHGVMNTDNTSISGETIDYGPCAMMDEFNPSQVFSSIDRQGRYAYHNQPQIIFWNLARLADTLIPLVNEDSSQAIEILNQELAKLPAHFESEFHFVLRAKFGLTEKHPEEAAIFNQFFSYLAEEKLDMTLSFYYLADLLEGNICHHYPRTDKFQSFVELWQKISNSENNQKENLKRLRISNPVVIPRNHQIEKAIQSAYQGNFQDFFQLLKVVQDPFNQQWLESPFSKPPKNDERVKATFCGT